MHLVSKLKIFLSSSIEILLLPLYCVLFTRILESVYFRLYPYRAKLIAEVAFKSFSEILRDSGPIHFSASQSGEDIIVSYIFRNRGISAPTYLDIGAHHPIHFSNTALFHALGSRGINVEPNPKAFTLFGAMRPNDINLQNAVGDTEGNVLLYIPLEGETLASINADHNSSARSSQVVVPMIKLSTILDNYANGQFPDFLSLDAEGLDFQILQQIPFERTKPKVICVETISYSTSGRGEKDARITNLLLSNGYMVYADTNINTIFVEKNFWVIN
jgi:FkbM family methyltransferase